MEPLVKRTTQRLEETPDEARRRKAYSFHEVESSLEATDHASTKSRTPSHYPQPIPEDASYLTRLLHTFRSYLPSFATAYFDNLTSYLGASNPLAHPAHHSTDIVWLLDNTAYRPIHPYPHAEQPWHAEFVACYFARDSGKDVSKWVADIAEKVGLHDMDVPDEEGERRIAERVRPFLEATRPARWVDVKLGGERGGTVRRLGPGGRDAISSQTVGPLHEIERFQDGAVVGTEAVNPRLLSLGAMRTYVHGPEGWLVVSDIDDTIKITQTPDPIGILRTTFVSTPQTTPGLPELYATLHALLHHPAWFYLSASPYTLYPFLTSFLHAHYPRGTLLLRDASLTSPAGLLQTLTQGVEAFKLSRLERIHAWLPRRRVLCVGDSTQSDPEAYGEAYRRWPGWVRGVFIRKVTGLKDMEERNSDERFERAFEGVPRSVWRVFESTEELGQAVQGLRTQ